jgi:zinc protease
MIGVKLWTVLLFALLAIPGMTEPSSFVKENQASFSSFVLSNGIPVYVKRNEANRVRNISLVVREGGTADPSQAGLTKLALATMARASARYGYDEVVEMLDATSSSIGASANFEYGALTLNALDKYFDSLFPVWADMAVNPGFGAEDFRQARHEAELAVQSKDQDPWAFAGKIMNAAFFENHPYAINPDGTEASLGATRVEDLKAWYEKSFAPERIFIVAVGSFDPEGLKGLLEPSIGAIPRKNIPPAKKAPDFGASPARGLIAEAHEQSRGVIYLRGDFPAPVPSSPDYMAASLAMKLFSDLLFTVVRDDYGAVYTPSALIRAFGANYGSISIYKTSAPEKIKSYIDETVGILSQGRCVSVDPSRPGEEAKFMWIEDALESYKRMYINEYFAAVRTNAAVSRLMIASVLRTGDPADWLFDVPRIVALTPSQVAQAFQTYLVQGNFTWVAVGDQNLLDLLPRDQFKGFGGPAVR